MSFNGGRVHSKISGCCLTKPLTLSYTHILQLAFACTLPLDSDHDNKNILSFSFTKRKTSVKLPQLYLQCYFTNIMCINGFLFPLLEWHR